MTRKAESAERKKILVSTEFPGRRSSTGATDDGYRPRSIDPLPLSTLSSGNKLDESTSSVSHNLDWTSKRRLW